MSNDTIIQLAIIVPLSIWLTSLSIRAMKSEAPSQYDPLNALTRTTRFIKVFSRRFLLPLSVFAVSLHFVGTNISVSLVAVIFLNLSISWLLVVVYSDKTLIHVIHLMDRVEKLENELFTLKTSTQNKEQPSSRPGSLLGNL